MIPIDSHTHSKFSFDSSAEPEEMIKSAVEKGIKNLCFTEHLDIDSSNASHDFTIRLRDYFKELTSLRERFKDSIDVIIGLEVGYGGHLDITKNILKAFPFEYVINSVHVHDELDYYQFRTYNNMDKSLIYEEYLDLVYKSLSAPYRFDAVGHLGYPSRFSPYSDSAFHYDDYKDILDKILLKIIEKELILEVNTSVYRSSHSFLATREMLIRYYDFGGRLITFSSDAHSPASLGRSFSSATKALKEIGFKYLTKSKNGKRELLEF